jgi:hypothetical protein
MDFVERWFGFSPDGGSGTFEVALLFLLVAVPLVLVPIARLMRACHAGWKMPTRTRI